MNKVILKTALVTLAALILAAGLVFSLWLLISPQTMAASCEKTGNYSFAVTCADLRYKYTKDVSDLARCAQDSISAKNDKLIIGYCGKLVSDEGFGEICERKDEEISGTKYGEYAKGYKGYICGNLAAAQYRTGSFENALVSAEKGSSYNKLVLEVLENGTKEEAEKIIEALNGSDGYLIKLLEEFINIGD